MGKSNRLKARVAFVFVLLAGLCAGTWWLTSLDLCGSGELGPDGIFLRGSAAERVARTADPCPAPTTLDVSPRIDESRSMQSGIADTPNIPENAIWIDCRFILPGVMPPDEEFLAVARGEVFENEDMKRGKGTFTTRVKDGVPFRVAFAVGTRVGELDLVARYCFLDSPLKVDVAEAVARGIVIEPQLGGVIRGRVLLPQGAEQSDAGRTGVVAVPPKSHPVYSSGRDLSSLVDMQAGGTFELCGLPPCAYSVIASSEDFSRARAEGVEVSSGQVSEVVLELARGVRVKGQVVGPGIEKRSGESVSVTSTDSLGRRSRKGASLISTGEEGIASFDCRGLSAGKIVVSAHLEGYLDAKVELGDQPDGAVIEGVRLELNQGLALDGRVLWPDGTAAQRATVRVFEQGSSRPLFEMKTDAEGRFHHAGLCDGVLRVTASAQESARSNGDVSIRPGEQQAWTAERTGIRPGTSGLALTLDPGESVAGRVVDDLGSPVTAFVILATPDRGIFTSGLPDQSRDLVSASFHDEDGQFLLRGLHPGKWLLTARSTRHADSKRVSAEVPFSSPGLELVLPRYARIRGVVLSPSGAMVAGAEVELRRPTRTPDDSRPKTEGRNKRTNSAGAFVFSRVALGQVQLVARARGFGASEPLLLTVGSGEQLNGELLVLRAPARITGRIDPAAGRVSLRSIWVRQQAGDRDVTVTSSPSGEFEVEDLEPGVYVVVLLPIEPEPVDVDERSRYIASCPEERVEVAEGETAQILLGTPPTRSIELRGRLHVGETPKAGWSVICESETGVRDATSCDDTGFFSLNLESPGAYSFRFSPMDDPLRLIRVDRMIPDQDRVDFDFNLPDGALAGQVRLPGGGQATGCLVMLELDTTDSETSVFYGVTQVVVTAPDGTFCFGPLPPGTYVLRAGGAPLETPGVGMGLYGISCLRGVRLASDESRDDLVIELQPAGSIEGLVLASDGSPAVGARVGLVEDDGSFFADLLSPQTDSRGRFELRNLAAGKVVIHARLGEFVSEEREVHVLEGESVEVQLQLEE